MDDVIEFTACGYLDFDRKNYGPSADMHLISSGKDRATKVVWDRQGIDGRELAQFCSKRGRINWAEGCLDADKAYCSDYTDHTHEVSTSDIKLDL